VPVVVLGIGKERFGIDLGDVAEVFPPVEPTPVPGASPVFAGVINVHGEIRPVLNLRRLLGMPVNGEKTGKGAPARVILLRKEGREVGLQIDSVEQIRWIGSRDMQVQDDGGAPASLHISAHVKSSTRDLLMLLSTEALLAEVDTSGLNKGVTS
jgi:chemotaxis signal transduction protein